MDTQKDTSRIAFIDALKGLAILAVLAVHNYNQVPDTYPPWLVSLTAEGARGVQMFFLLSGYTLFRSMQHSRDWVAYLARRYFRIAPLFYLAVGYYLLQDGLGPRYWLGDAVRVTAANIFSTLTFTNGLNPYWINSIVPGGWMVANVVIFYAMFPLLVSFISDFRKAVWWVVGTFITFRYLLTPWLSSHVLITDLDLWRNYIYLLYFPAQLPVFLMGAMMFYAERDRNLRGTDFVVISCLGMLQATFGRTIPNHVIFSFIFCFLLYGLREYRMPVLVNSFTTYLGKISYSIYLSHFAVLWLMSRLNLLKLTHSATIDYSIRYCILVILCVLLSSITYRLVEEPGKGAGQLFKRGGLMRSLNSA